MFFELPSLAVLALAWLMAAVCLGLALGRWFRDQQ